MAAEYANLMDMLIESLLREADTPPKQVKGCSQEFLDGEFFFPVFFFFHFLSPSVFLKLKNKSQTQNSGGVFFSCRKKKGFFLKTENYAKNETGRVGKK